MDHKRYMIYVHSKFMLIDDRYLIIGSANLNERSLAGDRDTEICASLWPHQQEETCVKAVQDFRLSLWSEHFSEKRCKHFDNAPADWKKPGSLACARAIQHIGQANWQLLNEGQHKLSDELIKQGDFRLSDKELTKQGHFCCWPFHVEPGSALAGPSEITLPGLIDTNGVQNWEWWPKEGNRNYVAGALDLAE